ncbi:hypothetical protein LTS17_005203 [Exophiala oligosperma]
MLCGHCRRLILQVERLNLGAQVTDEVTAAGFEDSLDRKCYLCTRLRIQLGDAKWERLFSDLSQQNSIAFDKSLVAADGFALVRLGCKLTPTTDRNRDGTAVGGYHFSLGFESATSTSDARVLDLVRHWLDTCLCSSSHATCARRSRRPLFYPTCLIDIGDGMGDHSRWKLVNPRIERMSAPYITLSHRWGRDTLKLDKETQESMFRGLPISELPGAYQDAITVTRHLGVRYLWIDSICNHGLRQDTLEDIQHEAAGMADVFGYALCNISALSGRQDGLFCARDAEVVSSDSVVLRSRDYALSTSYIINDLQLWRGELVHMPLTTRGWVLQEELLAARTVYFGARQVLWDCPGFRACETYPTMQPKRPLGMSMGPGKHRYFLHDEELGPISSVLEAAQSKIDHSEASLSTHEDQSMLFQVWTSLVAHYSLRNLTFPDDKLLAIAGISKLFGRIMRDEFVGGLWHRHFLEGLLWYIRPKTRTRAPLEYRAPSWSWASKDGYVMHADAANNSWSVARFSKVECKTTDGGAYGVVTSAILRLHAPSLELSVDDASGNWTTPKVPGLLVRLDATERPESIWRGINATGVIIRTSAYRVVGDAETDVARKVVLAVHGIVLTECVDEVTGKATGTYRRIGYFAVEDRRRSTLNPNWVPGGCNLFRGIGGSGTTTPSGTAAVTFPFDEQRQFLSEFDII